MDGHAVESLALSGSGDKILGEEVCFLPKKDGKVSDRESHLLSKEELLSIDINEPIYRRVRIGLIAVFWISWCLLLIASVLIIVFTPKCPPRPKLEFWQSKVGYWVNPFTFKDSDGDLVGDLKGLASAADYIDTNTGAGFIILGSLSPWYPKKLPSVDYVPSFKSIHPSLGDMDDFHSIVRSFKKLGKEIVLSLDFNGVPINHEYTNRTEFFIKYTESMGPGRAGGEPKITISGVDYYSTYGPSSGMVDLNLKNPVVIKEIKDVVQFWLAKGIDGVLLSDAAFYVETDGCARQLLWNQTFPECKLYTNETISVIQQIRKVVDEASSLSGRHKVLIADAGNTGHGVDDKDKSLDLLGTQENPGAHLVVSRQFVKNRGEKSSRVLKASINKYASLVGNEKRHSVAFSIATPSDVPHHSIYSLAATFLLPGTSIIYAGSELGWAPKSTLPVPELYPFGDLPVPDTDNDSVLGSNLPMPWDLFGKGFSTNINVSSLYTQYMQTSEVTETVEAVLAAGREYSFFNLTTDLLRLKLDEPSFLWGDFILDTGIIRVPEMDIFKRNATGFDKLIVVLFNERMPSTVVDMSSECSSLTPLLVYPANSLIEKGETLLNTKVYFAKPKTDALFVFKCVV